MALPPTVTGIVDVARGPAVPPSSESSPLVVARAPRRLRRRLRARRHCGRRCDLGRGVRRLAVADDRDGVAADGHGDRDVDEACRPPSRDVVVARGGCRLGCRLGGRSRRGSRPRSRHPIDDESPSTEMPLPATVTGTRSRRRLRAREDAVVAARLRGVRDAGAEEREPPGEEGRVQRPQGEFLHDPVLLTDGNVAPGQGAMTVFRLRAGGTAPVSQGWSRCRRPATTAARRRREWSTSDASASSSRAANAASELADAPPAPEPDAPEPEPERSRPSRRRTARARVAHRRAGPALHGRGGTGGATGGVASAPSSTGRIRAASSVLGDGAGRGEDQRASRSAPGSTVASGVSGAAGAWVSRPEPPPGSSTATR